MMKKFMLVALLLLVASMCFAVEVGGPTSITFLYEVKISDVTFRFVSLNEDGSIREGDAVLSEIDFDDISALNHNERVFSNFGFNIVYSCNILPGIHGNLKMEAKSSPLKLNGVGDDLVAVRFVTSEETPTDIDWNNYVINLAEGGHVKDKPVSKSFILMLENITGDKLPSGEYTGTISISTSII